MQQKFNHVSVRQLDQITALSLIWTPLKKSSKFFVLPIERTAYLFRRANESRGQH
jgi:hypothetical protein